MELSGTYMSYEELKALLRYVETLEDKESYLFSLSFKSKGLDLKESNTGPITLSIGREGFKDFVSAIHDNY